MKQKFLKWSFALAALGAAATLLDAYVLEKYFFSIKRFDIGSKGGGPVIKLLLLSDLHIKHRLAPQYYKLVSTIKQLKPDLILITGDTLHGTGSLETVDAFLALLPKQIKKAAIPGNHDHLAESTLAEQSETFAKNNVDLLVNESRTYSINGARITVTGLDDFVEGTASFDEALKDVGKESNHLLLVHSPLQQEQVKRKIITSNADRIGSLKLNIQYIFAGHNHGGQVKLPGYVPFLPKKSGDYVQGWYNACAPYLYVSKGFGTSRVPFRLFSRAEITLFKYHTEAP